MRTSHRGLRELCYHLRSRCPRLRIVATSREVLGLAGESAWRVPPLSFPEPRRQPLLADVAASGAVRLVVQRTTAVEPAFALTQANAAAVARICHQLDGIPLASELAAPRVTVLSVEQLTQRLEDALGEHAASVHRHEDTPEFLAQLRTMLKDEVGIAEVR